MCLSDNILLVADTEVLGAGSLLRKYVVLVCMHVSDVLPVAASIAASNLKLFPTIANIMQADISGRWQHSSIVTTLNKDIRNVINKEK